MKTVIAYILVIVLGQFAFTIGTMVGSGLFGILLYYLPLRIKIPLGLFLAGVLGSFTVIMYGYLIFWLFGLPFTFYPLLASILSMTLPLYNDYKMHSHRSQGIKEIDNLHPIIAEEAKALATGSFASIIGSFVGIALGLIYFLR
jgi:hypothetical protein